MWSFISALLAIIWSGVAILLVVLVALLFRLELGDEAPSKQVRGCEGGRPFYWDGGPPVE